MNGKKVFFLHIPKTAGQSVHAALSDAFGDDAVCPARVNRQMVLMSISEMNRYRVFSGHLDWSLLDCVHGERFTFTVLRKPIDRILSFYFYLRKSATNLSSSELANPERQGMKAALELTPHQYFTGGKPNIRSFLNEHYDNFYTYYFAGRRFNGRSALHCHVKNGNISRKQLIEIAAENMHELDAVYSMNRITKAFEDIRSLSGAQHLNDSSYIKNVNNDSSPTDRHLRLRELGATDETFERIEEYCDMDNELWRIFCGDDSDE